MEPRIVIGIDGGGTHTRAVAVDFAGQVLAKTERGGSSPEHNPPSEACDNVRGAIADVIEQSAFRPEDVACLVAGLAGLDEESDQSWAESFTRVPGITCERLHVNDAVVAHAGAFSGQTGIIVVSGTGSIIYGVTESGDSLRNYDFHHYARSGARHIATDALFDLLGGTPQPKDTELVADALAFWSVPDMAGLRRLALRGFDVRSHAATETFGRFAPIVTDHASKGSMVARRACDRAAEAIVTGVLLLGACFAGQTINVALIGGAVSSEYMRGAIGRGLASAGNRRYTIVEPGLTAELGAAWMALQRAGVPLTAAVRQRLAHPPRSLP